LASAGLPGKYFFEVKISDLIFDEDFSSTDYPDGTATMEVILNKSTEGSIKFEFTYKEKNQDIPIKITEVLDIMRWEGDDVDVAILSGFNKYGNMFSGIMDLKKKELHITEFKGKKQVFYDSIKLIESE
jgi:hypothetical protein